MTPQQKSGRAYWLIILLFIPLAVVIGVNINSNWPIFITLGLSFIVCYKLNRCPHCKKMVDLRSEKAKFCPHCALAIE